MSDELFSAADLDPEVIAREREMKTIKTVVKEEKTVPAVSFDKRLYIIDGYSVIYRNYFAHLSNPLTDKNGANISAYFGFFSTLFSLMSGYKMDYLAVVMDEKAPTFRKEMYPEYLETFEDQFNDILILNTFSYHSVGQVSAARHRAQARSYSAGGGGFSSGGGGGGSFGGGGSMGSR